MNNPNKIASLMKRTSWHILLSSPTCLYPSFSDYFSPFISSLKIEFNSVLITSRFRMVEYLEKSLGGKF
jgi:hypothetical protein